MADLSDKRLYFRTSYQLPLLTFVKCKNPLCPKPVQTSRNVIIPFNVLHAVVCNSCEMEIFTNAKPAQVDRHIVILY